MGEIRFVGTGETRGYPYSVCMKGKSQPRGRNVYKRRGLPSPWLKFQPRDLPILHGLAHDGLFFSHF